MPYFITNHALSAVSYVNIRHMPRAAGGQDFGTMAVFGGNPEKYVPVLARVFKSTRITSQIGE